jgi:hypothetical protein
MVQEAARMFEASTDASCRQARGLDESALRKQVYSAPPHVEGLHRALY